MTAQLPLSAVPVSGSRLRSERAGVFACLDDYFLYYHHAPGLT